ncbi:Uncharacterised protein [Klebsiella pneumoniae]|nr:hypothetical protein [Klebsiella pneumoniae]SVY84230.1 Uncharacterised protein [Klebsiella pneumoniae]
MNYDEITKITAERISDYMTEAVNTDSKSVAEIYIKRTGMQVMILEEKSKCSMKSFRK